MDEKVVANYMRAADEFTQYLDYIKSMINSTDKLSLNIGITSFIKIMEAERKKGEGNAEK